MESTPLVSYLSIEGWGFLSIDSSLDVQLPLLKSFSSHTAVSGIYSAFLKLHQNQLEILQVQCHCSGPTDHCGLKGCDFTTLKALRTTHKSLLYHSSLYMARSDSSFDPTIHSSKRDSQFLRQLRVDDMSIQGKADRGLLVFAAEGLRRLRCLDIMLVHQLKESQLDDFMAKLVIALGHFPELVEFGLSKSLTFPGEGFDAKLCERHLVRLSYRRLKCQSNLEIA